MDQPPKYDQNIVKEKVCLIYGRLNTTFLCKNYGGYNSMYEKCMSWQLHVQPLYWKYRFYFSYKLFEEVKNKHAGITFITWLIGARDVSLCRTSYTGETTVTRWRELAISETLSRANISTGRAASSPGCPRTPVTITCSTITLLPLSCLI